MSKRGADNYITHLDAPEDDAGDASDPGVAAVASESVLKQRKIKVGKRSTSKGKELQKGVFSGFSFSNASSAAATFGGGAAAPAAAAPATGAAAAAAAVPSTAVVTEVQPDAKEGGRTEMEMIALPRTALRVSRVCLGTMQFAAFPGHPAPSQQTVTATVKAAIDSGVNFFDAAECYGADHAAHKAFGAALKALAVDRPSIVIASKFGRHEALWKTDSPTGAQTVYDGAAVTAAIDSCLAALGVDYLDLIQVHWAGNVGILGDASYMAAHPELRDNVKEVVTALEAAVTAGKIKHVGVCNFGCHDLDEWKLAGGSVPVSNQVPYNPLWRAIEHTVLPRCIADNIAVLCYSSLQQGLLSGKYRAATEVPLGKRRTRLYGPASWSTEQCRHGDSELATAAENEIFKSPGGVLDAMRTICSKSSSSSSSSSSTKSDPSTVAETSLAWLVAQPGVTSVIVGASNEVQARRNAQVPTAPAELVAAFTEATEPLKAIQGPIVDQYAKESRIH